ncbi:hypothetical protein SMAC4_14130 [Sordaria macrospora]|uniref:uncharacterized protein n=1 Tax=Sordaria macrospora TaxID=5147 RepID=UPI002B2CF611|nr:hypothetical protein SMAC4_14130 [Sordaria macrospora]
MQSLFRNTDEPCAAQRGRQTEHWQASSRSLANAAAVSLVGLFNAGRKACILNGQKKTFQKCHLPLQCPPRQPLTTQAHPPRRP